MQFSTLVRIFATELSLLSGLYTINMIKNVFSICMLLIGCLAAVAQEKDDALQVFFPVGSASLNAGQIPQAVVDSAVAVCQRGEKYTVLGVASPEGSYNSNVRLATRRANAIVKQLVQRTGMPDSMFVRQTKVADVSMLRDLVMQDTQLPSKEQVMELLSSNASTGAVLAKLKKLGDGIPYLYIKDRIFPYLRATVKPDKTEQGYHPDLAGITQPKVVHRNYNDYKQNAVAQSEQSRHSSSIKAEEITASVPESVPVTTAKADSVKQDSTSEAAQMANVKSDTKIANEEKSSGSNFIFWVIIVLLILALLALAYYHQQKVKDLKSQLASAKYDLNLVRNQKQQPTTTTIVTQKVGKEEVFNDGKCLYDYLQNGGSTSKWTSEQTETFISYYKLQNLPLIQSLQTEYDNLPLNHILFEVLVDMGKTDAEIQKMMNISQTTIRSYRFRIKNKKKS